MVREILNSLQNISQVLFLYISYLLLDSLLSYEFLDWAYGKAVKVFLILSKDGNTKNPVYFLFTKPLGKRFRNVVAYKLKPKAILGAIGVKVM